jgi:arabinose-5-phosphate isomerase
MEVRRTAPLERPAAGRDSAELIAAAASILRGEASALSSLADALDESFSAAVAAILTCRGQVIVSGMGKAGLVGQKISATLASTGTRSIFLHPAEAVHGDLGRVADNDVLLLLSFSGETEELNRLLPTFRASASQLIALTASAASTLGRAADIVLALGALREVCPLGLAPSTSTTALLALGDALALVVSRERGFTREAFAHNHPAGSLGRKLAPVDHVMRPLAACRIAGVAESLCDVLVRVSRPGRRSGAVMLVNDHQQLVGIFTDSDLARLLEQRRHAALDGPISDVMTTTFRTVVSGTSLDRAVDMLAQFKISELPVIDADGCPVGLLDITDVVGLVVQAEQLQAAALGTADLSRCAEDGRTISIPFPSAQRSENL